MPEKTIFEKILDGEIPSESVFEDENVYAFRDVNPQAPVHVLVIPKSKLTGFADLATADLVTVGRFMQEVARVAGKLGLEEEGYRIVFNQGKNGQQTVAYLHAHILGGRRMSWPPG
ncbi:MAG TPA: histidine triad nucleotide-binding protein [Spirochaetia bacterium]|nr:histidine triad nucleotide-binding protein [Spirochaetia bacterium]